MQGVFANGRNGVEVRDFELTPREGWVAVDVAYNGICGSDLHTIMGASPGGADVPLGHEIVGHLAQDTPSLSKGTAVFVNPVQRCGVCPPCRSGRTTFCFAMGSLGGSVPGGMAEQVLAPAHDLYALPEGVDLKRAALVEPLANCVHAVAKAGIRLGDAVHIVGAGPIGIISGLLAQRAGASRVTISDPAPTRRGIAEQLGLSATDAVSGDMTAAVVIDASGHPSAAETLTSWAATAGTIVMVGMYPPGPQGFDLFHTALRELTVRGSLTYDHNDIEAAIALLPDPSLRLEELVTDVVPLGKVAEAVQKLQAGEGMKILVQA